ncbi:hypothetical protein [Psychrobacter sp. 4Bb]|uniref:hypothetical protein n=1 Tax=Psychrobacter sp. 4Bb TaxID=888436 RepID=UPI000C7E583D|nr:hypothetical protein [Psychrobacter sp. 4Bb]PKH81167.1 hypothetical protein CXF60_06295 [Psychrobacter sp. 4Bb]
MTIRASIGNGIIATVGYVATKAAALSSVSTLADGAESATEVSAPTGVYLLQLSDPYVLVGFTVPNWLGLVFFVIALICGTIAGVNQKTPVDDKFKRAYLKPFYSLGFGILVTLFVVPTFYPDITIWSLIVPAAFFAAIGSVVIYYVIAFFISEKLWAVINTEAHSSAPEMIKAIFSYLKGILMAVIGRSDK